MKGIIIIFLVMLLAGLYGYLNFFAADTGVEKGPDETPIPVQGKIIEVGPQQPGSFVVVSRISLTKPGFAVIYENNNGAPGNIIGNSRVLPEGDSFGVSTGLVRQSRSGEVLYVIINEDSGDGLFTPSLDTQIKDEEGNVIREVFTIM